MTVSIFKTATLEKVRSSKNLRAILEHNRVNGKPTASIVKLANDGAIVNFEWPNADICKVDFASFAIATAWAEKRCSKVSVID